MKDILTSEHVFDRGTAQAVPPDAPLECQGPPAQMEAPGRRVVAESKHRRRSTVFASSMVIGCLIVFITVQIGLAALFEDGLAAFIVTTTLAITLASMIKPILLSPDRRR